jgi:uncharacterized protein YkwD
MPGTPPLGPAALSDVHRRTSPAARRSAPSLVLAVALVAVVLIAAAPARAQAACPSASLTPPAAPAGAVEAAITCLVNGERSARGLETVERAGALDAVARRHASDMVARRYFAHVSPTNGTVEKRARRGGYLTAPCWALGEDLGWAPPAVASPHAVVEAWMQSPGHRAVILDPDFRDLGIGIVDEAPTGDGAGATFVLEMGAMTPCARDRAGPRAKIRVS